MLLLLLLLLEGLFSPSSPSLLCGHFSPGARAVGAGGGGGVPSSLPLLLLSCERCRVAAGAGAGAGVGVGVGVGVSVGDGVDDASTRGTRNHPGAAILAAVRWFNSLSCTLQLLSHTLCPR